MDKKWPLQGATVRLTRNLRAPLPTVGQRPFHTPPTVSGGIKIGMDHMIHVPDLETQIAGFTPFELNEVGEPVDATGLLLSHYAGIYKRIK